MSDIEEVNISEIATNKFLGNLILMKDANPDTTDMSISEQGKFTLYTMTNLLDGTIQEGVYDNQYCIWVNSIANIVRSRHVAEGIYGTS